MREHKLNLHKITAAGDSLVFSIYPEINIHIEKINNVLFDYENGNITSDLNEYDFLKNLILCKITLLNDYIDKMIKIRETNVRQRTTQDKILYSNYNIINRKYIYIKTFTKFCFKSLLILSLSHI